MEVDKNKAISELANSLLELSCCGLIKEPNYSVKMAREALKNNYEAIYAAAREYPMNNYKFKSQIVEGWK